MLLRQRVIPGGGYQETTNSDETVLNEMEDATSERGQEKDSPRAVV